MSENNVRVAAGPVAIFLDFRSGTAKTGLVQDSEEREVALMVLRRGAVLNIIVTPQPWHGRGLLGASMNPI